jgi:hypothetical protein
MHAATVFYNRMLACSAKQEEDTHVAAGIFLFPALRGGGPAPHSTMEDTI